MSVIEVWGHRGSGATDSPFARERNDGVTRWAENTMPSFLDAFGRGVAAIETDAVRTADEKIVLTHSANYAEHVRHGSVDAQRPYIDQLTVSEVEQLEVGPANDFRGVVPLLWRLFSSLSRIEGQGVVLNLELKDCQGTNFPRRVDPPIAKTILDEANSVHFPISRIRFSSFSLDMLEEMSILAPKAKLAALTDIGPEAGGDVNKPIFKVGSNELYLPFSKDVIDHARERLPGLVAMHPEVRTLSSETVRHAAQCGLSLATWGWKEENPLIRGEFNEAARRAIALCTGFGVPLALITDYPAEMRRLVETVGAKPNSPRVFIDRPGVNPSGNTPGSI